MPEYSIERIARLDRLALAELIARQASDPARICCFRCESPVMVGIAFRGRVLCETCEQLERLRQYPARFRIGGRI